MSKHTSRSSQWFEASATRFNHMYGYVASNSFGLWDAVLVFKQRPPLPPKGQPKKERLWRRTTKHCGEYKRARQAMMAVEEAAKKMQAEDNPDRIL